jgi:hypothetical protein
MGLRITRKVEYLPAEKRLDFVIGFAGWFVLNVLIWVVASLVSTVMSVTYFAVYPNLQGASSLAGSVFTVLNGCVGLGLPVVANLGGLIYFGVVRRWIALGALSAFGLSALCVLCVGIFVAVLCLNIIPQR